MKKETEKVSKIAGILKMYICALLIRFGEDRNKVLFNCQQFCEENNLIFIKDHDYTKET